VNTAATIDNLTIGSGNTVFVNNGQSLRLVDATVHNGGILSLASTGSLTYLNLDPASGIQFTGGGIISLSNSAKDIIRDASGTSWLINVNNTIMGTGQIGLNTLALTNGGIIHATIGDLTVDPADADLDGAGTDAINDVGGVMRASAGATLSLFEGVFNNLGTIEALDGYVSYSTSAATVNNVGGTLTDGTWRAVSTGAAARLTLRGDPITQIAANTEVELSGSGAVVRVVATPLEDTLTTNLGTLRVLGDRGYATTQTLVNGTTGLLEFDGGAVALGGLANHGMLSLGESTSLVVPGPLGHLTLGSASELVVELAGTGPGQYATLDVAGTLSLDGVLDVRLADGFAPTLGDTFDVFDWTSLEGTFDSVLLPTLGAGLGWNTSNLYTSGELVVTSASSVPGDANRDGYVNEVDAQALAAHWGQEGGWTEGNFNQDTVVDAADAAILAANWGHTPGLENAATVPEPTMLILLLGLVPAATRRRPR
ncbi:MAG: hypothetical protein JW719_14690, partial [Pirellulales bacterium]|nr:hypothetical protein [Pirellulales bacterium]